ncbi:MAG: hypothetical protein HZC47_03210 [Methanobacterium sp.]|uniref:PsbP-related protein n=1 Tax=Methanobacterium sp. TaxID=2164 RepID=UPI003D659310|nr:hypothetical protein [Methanobacterium sp.]
MKKWIAILAVLLVVVCASGCTSQPQTYSGNGITFQYPGDWSGNWTSEIQQSVGSSSTVLTSLGKDNAGMAVAKVNIGSVPISIADLTSTMKSGFQSAGYQSVTEKTRTVSGENATEIDFKYNVSSTQNYGSFTFFKKNTDIYMIMISTPDNNQQTIDMILNSFKVL